METSINVPQNSKKRRILLLGIYSKERKSGSVFKGEEVQGSVLDSAGIGWLDQLKPFRPEMCALMRALTRNTNASAGKQTPCTATDKTRVSSGNVHTARRDRSRTGDGRGQDPAQGCERLGSPPGRPGRAWVSQKQTQKSPPEGGSKPRGQSRVCGLAPLLPSSETVTRLQRISAHPPGHHLFLLKMGPLRVVRRIKPEVSLACLRKLLYG